MHDHRDSRTCQSLNIGGIWVVLNGFRELAFLILLMSCASSVMGLEMAATAFAQPSLIDDFEDGNDDGWDRIASNQGIAYGPAIHEVVQGQISKEYRLWRNGKIPPGKYGFVGAVWEGDAALNSDNGYLRARIRTENDPTQVAVYMRFTEDEGYWGYWFGADTTSAGFMINRLTDGARLIRLSELDPSIEFGPQEDWMLEAGAVEDRLSLKVWEYGDIEPDVPQWVVHDDTFPTGTIALSTNASLIPTEVPTDVDARFDDLYFVPIVPGDFEANAILDASDVDILAEIIRMPDVCDRADSPGWCFYVGETDLNQDGVLDSKDRSAWVHDLKNTWFGDSNLDGEFNSTDLVAVFQAGEYEDDIANNSTWATGDWNGDTEFNTSDLVFAFQDGGFEAGPRAPMNVVPEPTSFFLFAMSLVAMTIQRHSRLRTIHRK